MEIVIAVLVAIFLSSLVGFIEVRNNSDSNWRSCLTVSFFIYLLVLGVGNTATTLAAFLILSESSSNLIKDEPTNSVKDESTNPGKCEPVNCMESNLLWFWSPFIAAFIGVFGFEIVLKNINLTFGDRGVLSINDWINKALDLAVASAVDSEVASDVEKLTMLVGDLRKLNEDDLNGFILQFLGQERLTELQNSSSQNIVNSKLMKAFALAYEVSDSDLSQLISFVRRNS